MDFLRKKAFQGQLNKVGRDLGLGGNVTDTFGGGSAPTERWTPFEEPQAPRDDDVFPVSAATTFDARPRNYPPGIHLFYVDRSILSDAARIPVNLAHQMFIGVLLGLVLNVSVAVALTITKRERQWVTLLVAGIVAVLVTLYELVTYETAFRGAYRTSRNLRARYLMLSALNVILVSMYTFLGHTFFNGWSRLGRVEGAFSTMHRTLTIIEALYWTVIMFFSVYVAFEYYTLRQSGEQGLSPSAMDAAINGRSAEDVEHGRAAEGAAPAPSNISAMSAADRARVEDIRNKYRSGSTF